MSRLEQKSQSENKPHHHYTPKGGPHNKDNFHGSNKKNSPHSKPEPEVIFVGGEKKRADQDKQTARNESQDCVEELYKVRNHRMEITECIWKLILLLKIHLAICQFVILCIFIINIMQSVFYSRHRSIFNYYTLVGPTHLKIRSLMRRYRL